MTKEIKIYDYNGNATLITIKNFENVETIMCVVISGDEILKITYNDGTIENYDSSDCRCSDFLDGMVEIPLSKIDEFSEIHCSYRMLDAFRMAQLGRRCHYGKNIQ